MSDENEKTGEESAEQKEAQARAIALRMVAVFQNGSLAAKQEILSQLMLAERYDFLEHIQIKFGQEFYDDIVEIC